MSETTNSSPKAQQASTLGYATFYFAFLLSTFGMAALGCRFVDDIASAWFAPASFFGIVVISVVFRYRPELSSASNAKKLITYACMMASPGYLLACMQLPDLFNVWAAAGAAFVTGCGAGAQFIFWQKSSVGLSFANYAIIEGSAKAIGCLLAALVLLLLPQITWPIFCLAFLVISLALAIAFQRSAPIEKSISQVQKSLDKVASHLDRRFRLLFALFQVVFGIAWSAVLSYGDLVVSLALLSCSVAIAVAAGLERKLERITDESVMVLVRICLSGASVALLLNYFSDQRIRMISVAAIIVLWSIFWAIDNSVQMQQAKTFSIPVDQHASKAKIVHNVGFTVGLLIGMLLMSKNILAAEQVGWSFVAVAVVVLLAGTWLIPLGSYSTPEEIIQREQASAKRRELAKEQPSDRVEGKAARAARLYRLTQREEDVLLLIVKGRGVKQISADLDVSEATAKTHQSNIYKKMDVHSKTDLLKLVSQIE